MCEQKHTKTMTELCSMFWHLELFSCYWYTITYFSYLTHDICKDSIPWTPEWPQLGGYFTSRKISDDFPQSFGWHVPVANIGILLHYFWSLPHNAQDWTLHSNLSVIKPRYIMLSICIHTYVYSYTLPRFFSAKLWIQTVTGSWNLTKWQILGRSLDYRQCLSPVTGAGGSGGHNQWETCQLHVSHIQWFTGSKPQDQGEMMGHITFWVQKCPTIMGRVGHPFVRLILLLFINIDGYFADLVSHFGVYVIQWFENQQTTTAHNQTSRQLKDLQPCHVQIDGLPRLNSKASGCGPQPTAHWNL